ncbi:uncharacterized protein METZ01_LOCUS123398 [marine metagenome]|uniref:Uncharacterized protein n=1 Tax=marine metagenome TaxID=408172 RepID=A0A381Y0J5_9ZZZZ
MNLIQYYTFNNKNVLNYQAKQVH